MPSDGRTIYAIGSTEMPFVKIGSTATSVQKRLTQLQTGQPSSLYVIASVDVSSKGMEVEKRIHSLLAEYHHHGEWFAMAIDAKALEQLVTTAITDLSTREAETHDFGSDTLYADTLGGRVLLHRKRQGLTQTQLGNAAGVDKMTIYRLEQGKIEDVKRKVIVQLARTL